MKDKELIVLKKLFPRVHFIKSRETTRKKKFLMKFLIFYIAVLPTVWSAIAVQPKKSVLFSHANSSHANSASKAFRVPNSAQNLNRSHRCDVKDCEDGFDFNFSICECESRVCQPYECPGENSYFDESSCSCVCKLQEGDCDAGSDIDYDFCECRRHPCDPVWPCDGVIDWNTCSCVCEGKIYFSNNDA
jgi:hypothetical protein